MFLVTTLSGVVPAAEDSSSEAETKPAKSIENSIGMQLVLIPAGEFTLGSPTEEVSRKEGEIPHRVTISRPFYMGAHEVTQAQYEKVMESNPSQVKGENHPVERVTWFDAAEFCRRLSETEGRTYRLPTEAEWEYAAQSRSEAPYCFGDDVSQLGQYAWFDKNSGGKGSHPVGEKLPNRFGLYDMLGNVSEWCQDWYAPYENVDLVDPRGPEEGSFRVIRGGTGSNSAAYCRTAVRVFSAEPTHHSNWCGFRVVCEP
jgi:formylglycine-generating enzyme required for sulfatase activity